MSESTPTAEAQAADVVRCPKSGTALYPVDDPRDPDAGPFAWVCDMECPSCDCDDEFCECWVGWPYPPEVMSDPRIPPVSPTHTETTR